MVRINMVRILLSVLLCCTMTGPAFSGALFKQAVIGSAATEEGPAIVDLGAVGQCTAAVTTGSFPIGGYSTANLEGAGIMTATSTFDLHKMCFKIKRPVGTGGTGSFYFRSNLRSDDGAIPPANRPGGIVASSTTTYLQNALGTTEAEFCFDFDGSFQVQSGAKYWPTIDPVGYSTNDYLLVSTTSNCSTTTKIRSVLDGSSWNYTTSSGIQVDIWGVTAP